ncbi:putative aminodeoxychorismate synthase [Mycena sanguinolenta]|uniref:aminodeoxychorismate synthase n=1 Tax=Mycena sanguinolenta TaxID=230812 RepID=A0A8H7CL48_9AGAR|nr:putative aminodeoxychorismate synthase [Mycena sanguinolenta]
MAVEKPRLLLIDSYDSFTFNLVCLCKQSIPNCTIYIIKNDALTIAGLLPFLSFFSAVIVGPGPGSPENDEDIGVIKDLWTLPEQIIPIFGVCLGLQSLGVAYGAQLKRLDVVKHGQISHIQHNGADLFHGVRLVEAVRYHSLHVVLSKGGELEELAWADDAADNGHVVMAVRHTSKPFWAVQYHPESVCTRGGGAEVIMNFWRLAHNWSLKTRRPVKHWNTTLENTFGKPWQPSPLACIHRSTPSIPHRTVGTQILEIPGLTAATVSELFGRFCIIGSLMQTSLQITHFVGDGYITLIRGQQSIQENLDRRDAWAWIADFMRDKGVHNGHPDIPFWGGLIGLLSYELGFGPLGVSLNKETHSKRHPDLNLMFVERSVVIDSLTGRVFIQSLIPDDDCWISDTASILTNASSADITPLARADPIQSTPVVTLPDKSRYIARIHEAKERIFAGDSYELCLTARSILLHFSPRLPNVFYQPLVLPIPFSSCGPSKAPSRKAPGITRAVAEAALIGSTKEVAENLMIVDLIRHDLHAVVGEDVQVKQFCGVEEYETVWQLVSVIEGKLEPGTSLASDPSSQLGWELLKKSLPPGSMTGAPKKRSVEILQTLEDQDRSIYSGVFGYWCVGGGSDWSVTIRSCFKYEDRSNAATEDCSCVERWDIGAGGAITALSKADAEWEEMLVKLKSVVGAFGVSCV